MLVACGPKTETEVVEEPEEEVVVPEVVAEFTMEEVAAHADRSSCYSVIDGKVYDLTQWMSKHPGGAGNVLKICGKDGSMAFSGKHGDSASAKAVLPDYLIGDLKK